MAARGVTPALPPALAPWAASLSLFPRELALDLGAMVRRIAALVGETMASRSGDGDPDGFSGLTRRGSYERLLHSEWLLADELPDEFARRAAMNEHLFVELARTHRAQHPLAVALFDCGPSQLGAPRLVQIAALIVLATRAARSQATFRWGVLQQPAAFFDDVSPASIDKFLQAHTHREPSATDIESWHGALGEGDDVGELWFVGSKRLTRFEDVRRQWHLELEDVLVPSARQVGVTMRHRMRNEATAMLDLPAPDSSVRLLRDPFAAESVPPPASVSPALRFASNVLFAAGGRALLARSASGDLLVQPYANSTRARSRDSIAPARQIAVPDHLVLAAAGWSRGKEPLSILASMDGIHLVRQKESSRFFAATEAQWPVFGDREHPRDLQPCFHVGGRSEPSVMFLDAAQNLWMTTPEVRLRHVSASVVAVRMERFGLLAIRKAGKSWEIFRARTDTMERSIEGAGSRAFVGFSAPDPSAAYGLFAVELSNGQWLTVSSGGDRIVMPPPGCAVAGVVASSMTRGVPSLVCIEEDRRTITLVGNGITPLARATGTIVHLTASSLSPQIAWVMENGEAEVFSLKNGQRMFRSVVQESS